MGDILKRAGLIEPRRRRRRPLDAPRRTIARAGSAPRTSAGVDPLTITDSHSRFLIETRIAAPTVEGSQAVFARAFAAYGLTALDPLRQRHPVRLAGSGRADVAFGMVAQARRRTPFHPPGLAAGERAP
jgi:hypothetical protein